MCTWSPGEAQPVQRWVSGAAWQPPTSSVGFDQV